MINWADKDKELKEAQKNQKYLKTFFLIWFIWLWIGICFYSWAPSTNLGFSKGLFFTMNVGYGVGWDVPGVIDPNTAWLNCVYIIVGFSLVATALGGFADSVGSSSSSWFKNLQEDRAYRDATDPSKAPFADRVKAHFARYQLTIILFSILFVWTVIMIAFAWTQIDYWGFRDSLYYAFASCTGAGIQMFEPTEPDWKFGITGFFVNFGWPLYGATLSMIAVHLIDPGDLTGCLSVLEPPASSTEIEFVKSVGGNKSQEETVEFNEYILLGLYCFGSNPQAMKYLSDMYDEKPKQEF